MSTRIFVDGSVYSPVDPYATAMLVEDGTVRWVGSDSGARSIADESATITELEGALLTPAFARALAPVAGKEAPEILDYLQAYRAAGYHTHTLLAGMEDVPDLVSALSYYTAEHGTPDIRLILNATGVETDKLISAIKALRPLTEGERAVKGLQLVGIFVTPTEAPAAAQVAEDAALLLLSIDANTGFTPAADAALAVRENHPWLSIRLDAAISTPQDPITDEYLTKLAEARINLGLSVCEPEEDEEANDTVQALLAHAGGEARETVASVARRANATGTSIALGSDTQLYAPGAWSLIRELVNDEHGISARSAFAALTRGVYRLAHEENPFTGQLTPDTPAYVAQWRVEALMVQAPDSRVASWSTDPRARIPLLPVLDEDSPLPILESIYTESN